LKSRLKKTIVPYLISVVEFPRRGIPTLLSFRHEERGFHKRRVHNFIIKFNFDFNFLSARKEERDYVIFLEKKQDKKEFVICRFH